MLRLSSLSSEPLLVNYARDASQAAIRPVARFIAPIVSVPDIAGPYKIYSSKNRYKRANTRKIPGVPATRIGFDATDGQYNLVPNALDFPIPNATGLSEERLRYYAQYGTTLLADASGLAHEADVMDAALAAAGAGNDHVFTSDDVDPITILNASIMTVMKAAKNGAPVKVLFGATAFARTIGNANVIERISGGGSGDPAVASIQTLQRMLFGNPKCEIALYVEDSAPEGKAEDIDFMLDDEILIFACNDTPNTMDPSFMKTFAPMGGLMVPGAYTSADEREEVLKMDWSTQIVVTNSAAIDRVNATAA